MSIWIWVVVVVLVVVVLLIGVRRQMTGSVDPTQLLLDPELVGRVRALAEADQKIPAIKMLRDGTPGLGLASAKQMVDRMAAPRRPAPSGPTTPAPRDLTQQPAAPDSTTSDLTTAWEMMPSASSVPLEVELQARSLKSAGQPISAIKLVREHTSWGLREAKDYVDGL